MNALAPGQRSNGRNRQIDEIPFQSGTYAHQNQTKRRIDVFSSIAITGLSEAWGALSSKPYRLPALQASGIRF